MWNDLYEVVRDEKTGRLVGFYDTHKMDYVHAEIVAEAANAWYTEQARQRESRLARQLEERVAAALAQ